jgi:hypothetical protein
MMKKYDIAAYVWPSFTGDELRSRQFWPEGIGEWQTVKNSVKKFPEHSWPRKPLWGYVNEADPHVMEMQIDVAAEYGVNVFIYDWYWYDRRPFLENCLNDGYLKAKNNDKVKFYIMWANHNANDTWDIRNSHILDNVIWDGAVDRKEFEIVANRLIEKYFKHPSYYKIDGKPVLMIYDTSNLIRGLGSVSAVKDAFEWFRNQCIQKGLKGLHLQMVKYSDEETPNVSGVDGEIGIVNEFIKYFNYDSITHYQYVHFTNIQRDYNELMKDVYEEWKLIEKNIGITYFPHISIGWDNNPRFKELSHYIIENNTPENIEKALRMAKEFIDTHPNQPPLITINSWNEWTETSYLEPDDLYGYGYLDAIKRVFIND